jgi:transposase-like protein
VAHGKAKLTPAGRLLRVAQGWAPAHAAAMAGVSRTTAQKWLRRWRTEGLGGLEDRSSRPHRCPHRTPVEVEAAILELRRQWRRGPHLMAGRLGVAPSTIHAVLARHRESRLSRLDRIPRESRSVTNELDPESSCTSMSRKLGRIPAGGGWRSWAWQRPTRLRQSRLRLPPRRRG